MSDTPNRRFDASLVEPPAAGDPLRYICIAASLQIEDEMNRNVWESQSLLLMNSLIFSCSTAEGGPAPWGSSSLAPDGFPTFNGFSPSTVRPLSIRVHPWRSVLTEIYLCHTCSCHEITLTMKITPGQAPGGVSGPVVYANYGRREDFELLAKMGVNVSGCIVLARYGKLFRGERFMSV
eukprot:COSAG01_NODE_3028_length_6703_cov_2.824955_8_plen_179_part_00